jgi:hypothetical protein
LKWKQKVKQGILIKTIKTKGFWRKTNPFMMFYSLLMMAMAQPQLHAMKKELTEHCSDFWCSRIKIIEVPSTVEFL